MPFERVLEEVKKKLDTRPDYITLSGSAEPTNNRVKRSLRPTVISRKISCGNKTERVRESLKILASLSTT